MVLVQASKLSLPSSSPPQTTSILFEPNSHSLALMHSDSSISLFPSLSFPSLYSLLPKPQILIAPPSSSSSFLLLQQNPDPNPRVVFLVAGPHKGGSQVLLRFFIIQKNNHFSKAQVVCNQKGLAFDSKLGVSVDMNHGVSIKIVGSINFFAMYLVSTKKVSIFAVKLVGDGDVVKLMRCAVIECCVPVWSISISFGFLILGEDHGVRVFSLRQLVKGKAKKVKNSNSNGNLYLNGKLEGKGIRLPNGIIGHDNYSGLGTGTACNGFLDGKNDKHGVSVKHRSIRCSQDLDEEGACFVAFKSKEVEGSKSTKAKAISIQALSPKTFMILDSTGDLHILGLSNPVGGSNIISHIRQLPPSMKVQKLAVVPDISTRTQTVWISDGFHSVLAMTLSDMDTVVNKNDSDESREKLMQFAVIQAIFAGEKIQDLIPLAANGILILGQGNVHTYAIS